MDLRRVEAECVESVGNFPARTVARHVLWNAWLPMLVGVLGNLVRDVASIVLDPRVDFDDEPG